MSRHYIWCTHCNKLQQTVEIEGYRVCPVCQAPPPSAKPNRGVIQDTLKNPMRLDSLRGRPYVESVSDIKRELKRHDEKYGTKLVMG
jgi:hypothetical protein